MILGAKFWLMRVCSTPLPFFDQWDAEGNLLLRPWLHGQLRWEDLFAPWVQHRIVWTRLLVLSLFIINGQWDTQVEMIAAALVHSTVALILGAILLRRLDRRWKDAILICLLLLFALPFANENTLSGGFQSQFYFLLLFSVLGIWGLGSHPPSSPRWWVGGVCVFLGWFTAGTGSFSGLAVACSISLRLFRPEGRSRDNWLTLVVALVLGLGSLCLNIGVKPYEGLRTHSVGEFLGTFIGLLAWPNPTLWLAALAFGPFFGLLWMVARGRWISGAAEAFIIPLGFFALAQLAAIAYARSGYHTLEVSRYMDFQSIGALVNFACLTLFVHRAKNSGRSNRQVLQGVFALAWLVAAGYGLSQFTRRNLAQDLPMLKASNESENRHVAAYLADLDFQVLVHAGSRDFMCGDGRTVYAVLGDPLMRRILPAQVSPPVVIDWVFGSTLAHKDPPPAAWVRPSGSWNPPKTRAPCCSAVVR